MHEVWCLHGAVGSATDWKPFAHAMAGQGVETRAVDLWRMLECCPMPLMEFGRVLNAECRGLGRKSERQPVLLGYSMGGRLALHALLDENPPWRAAVIVGAHPGLESEGERIARRATRSSSDSSPGCAPTMTAACHGGFSSNNACNASRPPIE